MEIKGYKAFNADMTNSYGMPFKVGETYKSYGDIKFGVTGNGFHMCLNLCDVFRYFYDNVVVAEVTGRGRFSKYDDEYNGYYDMYSVEEITIDSLLSREEIIKRMLVANELDNKKFLATFRLTDDEKYLYLRWFRNNITMIKWLLYYQSEYKDIFSMDLEKREEILRKVYQNG